MRTNGWGVVAGWALALSLATCGGARAAAAADSAAGSGAASAAEPFAFADFSWVPGNAGASDRP